MSVAAPEIGELVRVRGQHWVVTDIYDFSGPQNTGQTLVDLLSVSDGGYGSELKVVWEIEPGRAILPAQTLPEVTLTRFDSPQKLAAFLDAIRWSAVTSADTRRLQAPFRSGVKIEDYQLEPVARALRAPRVNLLIADDVGLGKTIEAGLIGIDHRSRGCGPGWSLSRWQVSTDVGWALVSPTVRSCPCQLVRSPVMAGGMACREH